jgi:hypothetical protein
MVDPRIYRGLLVLSALAVIIFGFSLQNQPRGLGTSIAPGAFFSNAGTSAALLAKQFPNRAPGSSGDQQLASDLDRQLSGEDGSGISGFSVQTADFSGDTASGKRLLQTVAATRSGLGSGTIVVVSHRDASDLSGTAVLLNLAQALSGETLDRSVMLVSTSGQVGAAGTTQLAKSLAGQQVDAVILLGDLASSAVRTPIIVPWSNSDKLAPSTLRRTLGDFVSTQAGLKDESSGLAGQFARLAFPFAITEQAPFGGRGIPAVLLSLSGDRPDPAGAASGPTARTAALGTAVLQTVNALDQGPTIAPPGSYLLLSGKLVPLWAVQLLVIMLILPVAATTLDAVARTRRRGHTLTRWLGWVMTGALPFVVGLVGLLIARAAGLFSATPPGAVGDGAVKLTGGDAAVLGIVLVLMVASFVFLRPLCLRALARRSEGGRRPESPAADAAAVALSAVMCVLAVIVWALNPFAALLLVPALHLWLWFAQPGARNRRWLVALLVLIGAIPGLLVLFYYGNAYGLSPLALAWSIALMPGGAMSVVAALYWSVALGCLLSAAVIAARAVRAVALAPDPSVTVRGPAGYAGPGSLGGTESALRR